MSHSSHPVIIQKILIGIYVILLALPLSAGPQQEQEKQKKQEKKITEEILVVAEAPKDLPVSTVTRLDSTQIEARKPLDLSEAIRFAPGVTVTFGQKSVYTLKLRGMDSKRIALLVDGIPVYEPYYSSFDLKNFSTGSIESLQLTKGPSSVLYGPNTLGGIVNVITRRPTDKPQLSFNASYGEKNTRNLGVHAGYTWNRLTFSGSVYTYGSDGFYYPNREGGDRLERNNSEYNRSNINAKLYYNPTDQTEILFNVGLFRSKYSMPPEIDVSKPRYWKFKNWDRDSFNLGGFHALGEKTLVRFRAFYVGYDNTLDMFRDAEMTQLRFESTFDNAVYGFFAMTDSDLSADNQLKASFTYKGDEARTQDDVGAPWDVYDQATTSFGVEDHFTFLRDWKLVGGLSFDHIDKFIGENTSRINPLLGIHYSPLPELSLHTSIAKKSKFPSMRSMYSADSGNPDLLSESGTSWELGFTYNRDFYITGSVFITRFKGMIDSVSLPQFDFQRRYYNIAKARINGFEMQVQKSFRILSATLNYTYLDHRNESDDRPLDALPDHSMNFDLQLHPHKNLRVGLTAAAASKSSWLDFDSMEQWEIPSYFNLDSVIAYNAPWFEVFLKISNIFDNFIYTEPGFPWRGRYCELGIKLDFFKSGD